ncbi:MAG TPA: alpha/beta fold hydrolase [Dehalococcoidia bacterium]|nr:alpha/beta fold hydrolase [Dehalococcoidia bacterium]
MSIARVNGIDLYYEVHGTGEPVVLIMGLGTNATAWGAQIPALSREYKLIAFDNRGSGRSEKPANGYTVPQMADDTLSLMDQLGVGEAHVFGMSMGGMIAQEVYHRRPERVRTLILAGTLAGGPMATLPSAGTFLEFAPRGGRTLADTLESGLRMFYSDEFIAANRGRLVQRAISQMGMFPPGHALQGQFRAVRGYNAFSKLRKITAPTLVFGATGDRIVPFPNQETLAERIPNARFVPFEGAGHGFILERAEAVNRATLSFLREHPIAQAVAK